MSDSARSHLAGCLSLICALFNTYREVTHTHIGEHFVSLTHLYIHMCILSQEADNKPCLNICLTKPRMDVRSAEKEPCG